MVSARQLLPSLAFSILRLNDRLCGLIKYDESLSCTFAYGATLTLDLAKLSPEKISCIYVRDKGRHERHHDEAIAAAEAAGIPVVHNNRAFIARAGRHNYSVLCEFQKWEDTIEPGNHIVIVNVSLPTNAAAIFRSALAFGVHDIAIIADSFDSFTPGIIRVSMGARLRLRVEVFPTIEDYMERFPENNRYAFMLDAAKPLGQVSKNEPYSLIVGNESVGLPTEYADICQPVFIEQSSEIDSLNVSAASAIALYEFSSSMRISRQQP